MILSNIDENIIPHEEKEMRKMNYVYILECSDGTFYTGWTNNLERRIDMHSKGKGAKYTRGRGPVKLVHYEEFEEKSDALKREYAIKQLSREKKILLINSMQI